MWKVDEESMLQKRCDMVASSGCMVDGYVLHGQGIVGVDGWLLRSVRHGHGHGATTNWRLLG